MSSCLPGPLDGSIARYERCIEGWHDLQLNSIANLFPCWPFSSLMKRQDLNADPTQHQVWLLYSAVPFPFSFAMHGWFVVNQKGTVNRWEFGQFGGPCGPKKIGVFKNLFPLTAGMNKYGWKLEPRSPSKVLFKIEGETGSMAHQLAIFISQESTAYPFKNTYHYLGPNSHTYLQWVLNHFEELQYALPWRAVGKNYKGLQELTPKTH